MKPMIHSPTLINEEATSWGPRFGDNEDLYQLWCDCVDDVCLHDHVALRLPDKQVLWVEIALRSTDYWIGVAKTSTPLGWIRDGDLIRFHRINVYAVSKVQAEVV